MIEEIIKYDKGFTEATFLTKADHIFIMILNAIMENDLSTVKHYLSEDVYNHFNELVNKYTEEHVIRLFDEMNVKSTDIIDVYKNNYGINIVVKLVSRYMDYFIDEEGKYMWPGKYEVSMLHASEDGDKVPLKLEKESAGTQTLFSAGARVVKALQHGSFLAYDEMNIALHPLVFRRLVKLFNDKTTNPNNAQLLVTTHDTVLIDDVLLRADQVWFAEKTNGVTDLYSAIDFDGVSIDQPFGPWYRAGRLGGRPRLKEGTLGYVGQYNKTQD